MAVTHGRAAAQQEERLPERIGKYEIEGVAGHGAMGTVYIGYDRFIDRRVAIKVCRFNSNDADENLRARKLFLNEAQSVGALEHPNILRIYDAGEENGLPYMVMEFVEGGNTLRSYCEARNRLDPESAVNIIARCADALGYAHRRGITHRDIKPANIMLTRDGEPKIGDFGIAYRSQTDTTQVAASMVSPRYMSPEQAHEEELNHQTDLYSLGVTLYELLSSTIPFDAASLPALLLAITTRDPEPLQTHRPDLPESLHLAVNQAIARSLSERFQSGEEMANALRACLSSFTVSLDELNEERKAAIVRSLLLFESFSQSELDELCMASEWLKVPAGDVVVQAGDADRSLHVVVNGSVSIEVDGQIIAQCVQGECIGEAAFLCNMPRTATATANRTTTLLRIIGPASDWASIPLQMRLGRVLQNVLASRLAAASSQIAGLMTAQSQSR
ncbi:MAG: protein kinase [Gammaproteobacteria bacterium]|nr:protein kinase [Gammaproteobacteria bacterium]